MREVTIKENTVSWKGFSNLYEVLGFIDLKCNPQVLKQTVLSANVQGSEKIPAEDNGGVKKKEVPKEE